MLSDDQAWNGLSVAMHPNVAGSKGDIFHTPNLEKLAAQGMRFSAGYAPASVCSPTRVSLMTALAEDLDGRNWLFRNVPAAEALGDVLVADAWDGSARLVASWAEAIQAFVEVPGLNVSENALLELWPPTAPETP